MAKAFKCDVCGRYSDFNDKESNEIIIRHGKPIDTKVRGLGGFEGVHFDYDEECFECCPECMKKLCDAINFARGYTDGVL